MIAFLVALSLAVDFPQLGGFVVGAVLGTALGWAAAARREVREVTAKLAKATAKLENAVARVEVLESLQDNKARE